MSEGKSEFSATFGALRSSMQSNFTLNQIDTINILVADISSPTLDKSGYLEFPIGIISRMPVNIVKKDLDQILSNLNNVSSISKVLKFDHHQ